MYVINRKIEYLTLEFISLVTQDLIIFLLMACTRENIKNSVSLIK